MLFRSGGDFIDNNQSQIIGLSGNTTGNVSSISFGSGAGFSPAAIGDAETIFIGTDILGANNEPRLNFDRKNLSVGSNTGFAIGDHVHQQTNKIAFTANTTAVDAGTGFFSIPNANTLYNIGEVDRKSTRLNSSHSQQSRMPSSA